MDAWLIIVMLGIFALGFCMTSLLDRFLRKRTNSSAEVLRQGKAVAILGDPDRLRGLAEELAGSGTACDFIGESGFETDGRYGVFCAFSNDDLRNLVVCSEVARNDPHAAILAKCNDADYRKLYGKTVAVCLEEKEITGARILEYLKR